MKLELIEKIIDENRLITRMKKNQDSCPCYNRTRCHNTLSDYEMICLFCVCPEYDQSDSSGGCNLKDSRNLWNFKGKWFYHSNLLTGKVWDCSDCIVLHTEKFVRKYLEKLSINKLKEIQNYKDISSLWNFFKIVSWG